MIYQLPAADQPVDQGDIIDGCPILQVRQLHTVPLEVLETLCKQGRRKARIQPPYREHLAKHFADTYSRIGLPLPYETQ